MPKTLVTAPTVYPITVEEAKEHMNITATADDEYIQSLIDVATNQAEIVTHRALITQTWDYKVDRFARHMEMPLGKLQSVTHVKYYDTDGVQQTVNTSVYTVDTDSDPGQVHLAYDQSWPSVRQIPNTITFRVVVGYGATSASVPDQIKQWIKIQVANMFEMRESYVIGVTGQKLSSFEDALIWPYRLIL